MQPHPHFEVEHLENVLVRAPNEHLAMRPQALHGLLARPRRTQVHVLPWLGVVIPARLSCRDNVFRLAHEEVHARVEALRHGLVEGAFELFLLPYDGVEKVGAVNVPRELLVKVHLHHLLDRIRDVHELEEVDEGHDVRLFSSSSCLLCFGRGLGGRVPASDLLRGLGKARRDVRLAQHLQKGRCDLLDLRAHAMPVRARVVLERLDALQAVAVHVDQLQRRVEREEQLHVGKARADAGLGSA